MPVEVGNIVEGMSGITGFGGIYCRTENRLVHISEVSDEYVETSIHI